MKVNKKLSRTKRGGSKQFADGFQNPLLRMGLNTSTTLNGNRYIPEFKSFQRNRVGMGLSGLMDVRARG